METLRRLHNQKKRELILGIVRPGNIVLDCGCGRGGDWHKWKVAGALRIVGVDPDRESLVEAQRRADDMGLPVILIHGDIRDVHVNNFDVVCYNFSIHYILDSLGESAKAIARAVKPGGYLIGITPDKARITEFTSPDTLGNTVETVDSSHISVRLVDGPFYADGAKTEPVISRPLLEHALRPWFKLERWTPMLNTSTGLISDIYSTFIFKRKE
jgi:ubiquinone/menaquinone biosynthesis C-methylase UbiE